MKGRFPPIRSSRFPLALFGIVLAGLMLASGIHMGFIVLLTRLELVLRILRICGGSISVDSQLGQGSTFLVKLPARSKQHE